MYQSRLLEDWDHTSRIVGSWADKNTPFESLHPYRSSLKSPQAIKIPTRSIFSIEEERDGERISIIRKMVSRDEDS